MSIRDQISYHWPTILILAAGVAVATILLSGYGRDMPSVHMTVFAYRDVNRNGIYDIADRPYAGLKTTMNRPHGSPVEKISNLSGFTNFDMSRSRSIGDMNSPGEHTIHVEAPANWQVTSGNASQTIEIIEREASATGLVASTTYDAVGVAPDLRISGVVDIDVAGPGNADISLRARTPDGNEKMVAIETDGAFSFPAAPGVWELELTAHGKTSVTREVVLRNYSVVLSRFSATPMHVQPRQHSITIGFDDITVSDTLQEVPNGYAGVNWRNWVATHEKLYGGDGFVNAVVSSEYIAYSSSGHPATISSPSSFDFVGAYVTALWPQTADYDVVVRAWRGDLQVHEDRFRPSVAGPEYFDADYRGISKLEFASDGFWQIALDDITIR